MPDTDFEKFFARRVAGAEAYVNGDATSLDALLPKSGEASFHSPCGDSVIGAEAVSARYRADAQAFRGNGTSRFEVVQKAVSGDLAFWTGWQIATVFLAGADAPTDMEVRVTEVFKRASGVWQLVHRHADVVAK